MLDEPRANTAEAGTPNATIPATITGKPPDAISDDPGRVGGYGVGPLRPA